MSISYTEPIFKNRISHFNLCDDAVYYFFGDFADAPLLFLNSLCSDSKFETDPYDVKLHGLMTPEQYTQAIETVNATLRKSRAGAVDGALLATGMLLVPLAIWGVRHRKLTKKRKRLLKEAINEFNAQYPGLLMRWNRKPQSFLSIELRADSGVTPSPPSGFAGGQENTVHMVQARMIGNSGTANYQPQQVIQNPQFEQYPPQQQMLQQTTAPPSLL